MENETPSVAVIGAGSESFSTAKGVMETEFRAIQRLNEELMQRYSTLLSSNRVLVQKLSEKEEALEQLKWVAQTADNEKKIRVEVEAQLNDIIRTVEPMMRGDVDWDQWAKDLDARPLPPSPPASVVMHTCKVLCSTTKSYVQVCSTNELYCRQMVKVYALLRQMAQHGSCDRYDPDAMGSANLPSRFIGCRLYHSDDPMEYCLPCSAEALLIAHDVPIRETQAVASPSASIYINGRPVTVTKQRLTYEEVVDLATSPRVIRDKAGYTVVFSRGHWPKPEGSLWKGKTVPVKNGMSIDAILTNNA